MSRTQLVVEFSDREIFFARCGISKIGSPALIDWSRKPFGNVHGRGTYCRRRQAIVHEGDSKGDIPHLTPRGSEGCKVTRKHVGCRYKRHCVQRTLPCNCALVTREEKQFVLPDRTTNGSAILVA